MVESRRCSVSQLCTLGKYIEYGEGVAVVLPATIAALNSYGQMK